MEGGLSILHWLILLPMMAVLVGGLLVPAVLITRKAGFSGWWGLIILVPMVGWVALWVFALVKWPVERSKSEQVF